MPLPNTNEYEAMIHANRVHEENLQPIEGAQPEARPFHGLDRKAFLRGFLGTVIVIAVGEGLNLANHNDHTSGSSPGEQPPKPVTTTIPQKVK